MDEFRRNHVPASVAFGSWEHKNECDHLPYSQCFESATKDKLLGRRYRDDCDFFITRKFYEHIDVATPASMIMLPRQMEKPHYRHVKDGKKEGWVVCAMKQPLSTISAPPRKAVDEDLYKISPDLLRVKPRKLSARGFLSMCLGPCALCKEI